MKLTGINQDVSSLKGIGPKRKAALEKHQIKSIEDLLNFFPKKYLDRSQMEIPQHFSEEIFSSIKALVIGRGQLQRRSENLSIFTLPILWENNKATAIFFNQSYLKGAFKENQQYYFYGKIQKKANQYKIINPQFVPINKVGDFFELTPVYKKINGVPNEGIRKMMLQIFESTMLIEDDLPESIRLLYGLLDKKTALKAIHFPKTIKEILHGKNRLKFDEALKINLGILSNEVKINFSEIEITNAKRIRPLIKSLPYELTNSQEEVIKDILGDFKKREVMNRLVQGEVGSGKTVIAVMAAALMAENGYQTAYMAPTELLAKQHGRSFTEILKETGISVEIITGNLKAKERRTILENVATGKTQIMIGTHALIQDAVDYYNLGLVITDEQHRFGVKQRGRLFLKGKNPHTMVMSATPIPRTLALILYGDLSVSYMDELPKGRKPIKTYCYDEASLYKIFKFMENELKKGQQGFIICPFIEASEEMEGVRAIESVYEEVKAQFEPQFSVGFLHSRLNSEEKENIIENFNQVKTHLLVATSIIEVGIDVPNVSVICILSAERFGLSQLHQLRGRVGRGKCQSFCFLVTNSKRPETLARMEVIVKNSNGRKIADEDYRLRGPGDYFGLKQHGFFEFDVLNPMEDMELIQKTRDLAREIQQSKKRELMVYREKTVEKFYQDIQEISLN